MPIIFDEFWRHEKWAEVPFHLWGRCAGLYALALSWASDQLTDGVVPAGQLPRLGGTKEQADWLVDAGFWDRDGSDYAIHNYLVRNPTRESVEAKRAAITEARRQAGRAGGIHTQESKGTRKPPSKPADLPTGLLDAETAVKQTPSKAKQTGTPTPTITGGVLPSVAHERARDGLPNITPAIVSVAEVITGMTFLQASRPAQTELDRLMERHGYVAVGEAMAAVRVPRMPPSITQLVYGARNILEPLPGTRVVNGKAAEADERAAAESRRFDAEVAATRRRAAELRGEV